MPTRTWRGNINSNPTIAGNWAENAVPVAGDDIVFDSVSSNPCQLVGTFPTTGQFQSLVMTGYTGTLHFGNHIMHVGQGDFAGTIFNAGTTANFTCGNGGIQLFANAVASTGRNVVFANNINLQNVNFFIHATTINRIIDLQSHWYLKNLHVNAFNFMLSTRTNNIFVYGNLSSSNTFTTSGNDISIATNILYLRGTNGTINLANGINAAASIIIETNYTLLRNLMITHGLSGGTGHSITYSGGMILCNNFDLILNIAPIANVNSNINMNRPIDNLILLTNTFNTGAAVILQNDLTVNNKLIILERAGRGPTIPIRSQTVGTHVNINIGNNCKYIILNALLQDIRFNRPVTSFYSQLNNCVNISNRTYPQIKICTS